MSREPDDKVRWKDQRPVTSDPAYGTSRDPHAFYEARVKVPAYVHMAPELEALINVCHDALATRVYLLLRAGCDFQSGELLTTYKRLRALCSPFRPQSGKRKLPWSYWQIRNAVGELEALGLVRRDTERNEAIGELRLYVTACIPDASKNARPRKETAGVTSGSEAPPPQRGNGPRKRD